MGYWAVLRLGSSCCCLRKLNETNGVDGSEGEVMETDAGADMATALLLLLKQYYKSKNNSYHC